MFPVRVKSLPPLTEIPVVRLEALTLVTVQEVDPGVAVPEMPVPDRGKPFNPLYDRSIPLIATLSTFDSKIAVPVTLCRPLEALLMTIFSVPVVPIVRPALAAVKPNIAIALALFVKMLPEAVTAAAAGAIACLFTPETLTDWPLLERLFPVSVRFMPAVTVTPLVRPDTLLFLIVRNRPPPSTRMPSPLRPAVKPSCRLSIVALAEPPLK